MINYQLIRRLAETTTEGVAPEIVLDLLDHIDAVRALHVPNGDDYANALACANDGFMWPCPTIRALGGAAT